LDLWWLFAKFESSRITCLADGVLSAFRDTCSCRGNPVGYHFQSDVWDHELVPEPHRDQRTWLAFKPAVGAAGINHHEPVGVGGGMVIYLAGLQGIPTALYEAAEIDGANSLQN